MTIGTPLVGRTSLANILAATAVAQEFGVPLSEVASRAAQLRPAAHRGEVLRLASGVTVIDDSYNANPTATKKAIDVLASARRIYVATSCRRRGLPRLRASRHVLRDRQHL